MSGPSSRSDPEKSEPERGFTVAKRRNKVKNSGARGICSNPGVSPSLELTPNDRCSVNHVAGSLRRCGLHFHLRVFDERVLVDRLDVRPAERPRVAAQDG